MTKEHVTHNEPQINILSNSGLNGALTMSSREIAELVNKEHRHLLRDIRAMLETLGTEPKFGLSEYTDKTGRKLPEYRLPKRETLILVSGYKVKLRARIIDRWHELEEQIKNTQPVIDYSDPAVLLGVLNNLQSEKQALESQVQTLMPAQTTLERIRLADGSLCITDSAKTLQVRPKDLFNFLSSRKWTYRRAGGSHWVGYQDKIQAGYLEHKVTEVTRSDGTTKITEQVLITSNGLVKLAELLQQPLH